MVNCKNCGSKINNKINFCSNCGKSITNKNVTIDKKKFIELSGTNIKISNIKNYGVSISDQKYKAIKVPIFEINPKYVQRKEMNSNKFLKTISLTFTSKYLRTGKRAIVGINEFNKKTYNIPEQGGTVVKYELPYLVVKLENGKKKKDSNRITIIEEINEELFIYWDYLYVNTYQNENYQFYGYDINTKEKLAELNTLVNI